MKTIKKEMLSQAFLEHDAILLTEEGIILDCQTSSPIIKISKILKKLGDVIKNAYLDPPLLIIQCALSINHPALNNEFYVCNIKKLIAESHADVQQFIVRAVQWLTWDSRLQHCSQCGNKVMKVSGLAEKKCLSCHLSFFPNLAPAIIVLIQREHEILLARSAHFHAGFYSALAGFIDIGETAESAVHREIKEEVGLEVSELEYFGSQSWPFPNSFMIAFKAQYLRGDIHIDPHEIEDACWFHAGNLPALPSHASIARQLIESTLEKLDKRAQV